MLKRGVRTGSGLTELSHGAEVTACHCCAQLTFVPRGNAVNSRDGPIRFFPATLTHVCSNVVVQLRII